MLSPSRVKYRKVHKGRTRGQAKGGTEVSYGDFGLQALECVALPRACPAQRARPVSIVGVDQRLSLRLSQPWLACGPADSSHHDGLS